MVKSNNGISMATRLDQNTLASTWHSPWMVLSLLFAMGQQFQFETPYPGQSKQSLVWALTLFNTAASLLMGGSLQLALIALPMFGIFPAPPLASLRHLL